MDMMTIRRRVLMASKKKRLPSEYQEVEWIESSGSAYIRTAYVPTTAMTRLDMVYMRTATPSHSFLFCSYKSLCSAEIRYRERWYACVNDLAFNYNTNTSFSVGTAKNEVFEWLYDGSAIYINGQKPYMFTNVISNYPNPLIIGASDNNGTIEEIHAGLRVYKFQIDESNALSLNLVPCYRKSDGEIGMYDTASKTFYTNAGTGTFLKGADV